MLVALLSDLMRLCICVPDDCHKRQFVSSMRTCLCERTCVCVYVCMTFSMHKNLNRIPSLFLPLFDAKFVKRIQNNCEEIFMKEISSIYSINLFGLVLLRVQVINFDFVSRSQLNCVVFCCFPTQLILFVCLFG